MDKYVIKDIKSIIINGKEYSWTPYAFETTPEEIRGGMGIYKPRNKSIENADKFNITNKEFSAK